MGFIGNRSQGKLRLYMATAQRDSIVENLAYVGGNILDSAETITVGSNSSVNKQALINDIANFTSAVSGLTNNTFIKANVQYDADVMPGTAP